MKTTMVLTALGIATLIATPAFAQKHHARTTDAYASAVQQPNTFLPGHMTGTDPDPSIRSELQRDWATYSTSN